MNNLKHIFSEIDGRNQASIVYDWLVFFVNNMKSVISKLTSFISKLTSFVRVPSNVDGLLCLFLRTIKNTTTTTDTARDNPVPIPTATLLYDFSLKLTIINVIEIYNSAGGASRYRYTEEYSDFESRQEKNKHLILQLGRYNIVVLILRVVMAVCSVFKNIRFLLFKCILWKIVKLPQRRQ